MMREERLFSGIYIVGTALAIAFTMVMAVVYYIKLAPIYPEPNRARTIYFEGLRMEADNGVQRVTAHVPLSEMFGYATDMRSKTQGRGQYVMEPDTYAEVPKNIAEKIMNDRNKRD